jgi:membrane-associated phospholipid phosphatase
MEAAHETGERPTAAFPSSHVGVTVILSILAWKARNKSLFILTLVFLVLINLATIYLRAHYVIDIIAGWITAIVIYTFLHFFARKFV